MLYILDDKHIKNSHPLPTMHWKNTETKLWRLIQYNYVVLQVK